MNRRQHDPPSSVKACRARACSLFILLIVSGCEAVAPSVSHAQPRRNGGPVPAVSPVATAPPLASPAPEFEAAVNRAPSAKTMYAMARIFRSQGRDAEADGLLRRVIRQYPAYMPASCDLAELQMRQRHVDEAIDTLKSALQLAPREAVLWNDLGMCYLLRADYKTAAAEFERAAGIAPDDARYRANLAVSLGMTGRYTEAFALYRQVLGLPEAHYNLAILCDARGDHDRASLEFEHAAALGLSPATQPAQAVAPSEFGRSIASPARLPQSGTD